MTGAWDENGEREREREEREREGDQVNFINMWSFGTEQIL